MTKVIMRKEQEWVIVSNKREANKYLKQGFVGVAHTDDIIKANKMVLGYKVEDLVNFILPNTSDEMKNLVKSEISGIAVSFCQSINKIK